MSGGSYDYAFRYVDDFAGSLRERGSCYAAPPVLRRAFAAHCRKVAIAMQACEWNDSSDGNDMEKELIEALVDPGLIDIEARKMLVECATGILESLQKGVKR